MKTQGFTLIEIVLAIALSALFASVAALAFKPALDTWAISAPRDAVTDSLAYALSRMTSEIAQIKNTASVQAASSGSFQFTDVSNNSIHYYLSGNHLMRNNDILGRGVQVLSFQYFDVNQAALASPTLSPATNIWRVTVQMTVQKEGQAATMETVIHPRNFPRGS